MSDFDRFLDDDGVDEFQVEQPEFFITVTSASGGQSRIVSLEDENSVITCLDACAQAGVRVTTGTEFYVDANQVDSTHQIGSGATLTAVESVKGG